MQSGSPPFSAAAGERVYAIGDVHGCYELLTELLVKIRNDNDNRPPAVTRMIFLGDVVDRGPFSLEVVSALMRYTRASPKCSVLMGNHEQVMAAALGGDPKALVNWLDMGGLQTLASWGVPETLLNPNAPSRLLEAARRRIGPEVVDWLERLPLTLISGDLLFVHAGLRPGVLLSNQVPADLLWIREPFLDDQELSGHLVVHGHTIYPDGPDIRPNRIGLDTGAFKTGRLTAMGFEGADRWVLAASSTGRA